MAEGPKKLRDLLSYSVRLLHGTHGQRERSRATPEPELVCVRRGLNRRQQRAVYLSPVAGAENEKRVESGGKARAGGAVSFSRRRQHSNSSTTSHGPTSQTLALGVPHEHPRVRLADRWLAIRKTALTSSSSRVLTAPPLQAGPPARVRRQRIPVPLPPGWGTQEG